MSDDRLSSHLVKLARTEGGVRCGVCSHEIQGRLTFCSSCESPYHRDCWQYNSGCAIYGCREAPDRPEPVEVEVVIRRAAARRPRRIVGLAGLAAICSSLALPLFMLEDVGQNRPGLGSAKWDRSVDLSQLQDDTVISRIKETRLSLQSGETDRIIDAIEGISFMGLAAPALVPDLAEALLDPSPAIRDAALQALWDLEEAAAPALPRLQIALRDMDPKVRRHAAWAIGRIGSAAHPAIPALFDALLDLEDDVRTAAIWSIGNIGEVDQEDLKRLTDALASDSNSYVRSKALEILLVPGRDRTVMTSAVFIAAKDEEASIREIAMKSCDGLQKSLRRSLDGIVEQLSLTEDSCACCARLVEVCRSMGARSKISCLDMQSIEFACVETHDHSKSKCWLHKPRGSVVIHGRRSVAELLEGCRLRKMIIDTKPDAVPRLDQPRPQELSWGVTVD